MRFDSPTAVMRHALELARRGLGAVEPNPAVGAVLVDDNFTLLGEGWHQQYGGPHAEIHAIRQAGERSQGSSLFVTLEPCCHQGKTPPCTQAVLAAGIRRVIVATTDPNPQVAGGGVRQLTEAGLLVEQGLLQNEAEALIAPFRKLITTGRPWVIAKWAMTLDGKLATHAGDSRWISNDASRQTVHELRGRMDAILVGVGTAIADNPLLTARPAGPRTAVRIVVDSQARLPVTSQLALTAHETPVLLAVSPTAEPVRVTGLERLGVEVLRCPAEASGRIALPHLLGELGRRKLTNVLVEGGSQLFGTLFDQQLIDEVYAFIAPKLVGGKTAVTPWPGNGLSLMSQARMLIEPEIRQYGDNVLIHGRLGGPDGAS